ncbi:MAG TPA: hypothetical protein VM238_09750 [Phycisphaerae bacterium]|nr:hypothetical protein [Phycisphaerae bacterium]
MKRRCPKCGAAWEIKGPIGSREECPECAAFMHTCANCRHYDAGLPGCRLPNTEPVRDPHGGNFCEEFEYVADPSAGDRPAPPVHTAEDEGDARHRFEDLFRESDP